MQNSSKSAPVIEKTMFNMCFYPQGVHRIKVLALGPLLAILIFHGPQMTLVSDCFRRLPKVSDGFPRVSEAPRWCPKVPRLSPTLHACKEKSDHSVARKN